MIESTVIILPVSETYLKSLRLTNKLESESFTQGSQSGFDFYKYTRSRYEN